METTTFPLHKLETRNRFPACKTNRGCSYIFLYIMLPLLRPALLVAGLFRLIDSVKAFPHIFIMTGGGPGVATEATNYYAYLQGFSYTYIGFSSAIIVVMLIATLLMSITVLKLMGKGVEVE